MPFPFNSPHVYHPKDLRKVDVSDLHDGDIRLEPGILTHEQIAELMQDAEVYIYPVE